MEKHICKVCKPFRINGIDSLICMRHGESGDGDNPVMEFFTIEDRRTATKGLDIRNLKVFYEDVKDRILAKISFAVIPTKEDEESYRDFFVDDLRNMLGKYHTMIPDIMYILTSIYYNKELCDERYLKLFIYLICEDFSTFSFKFKTFTGMNTASPTHFIGCRYGYESDPDKMSDEEYKEAYEKLTKQFESYGFISTNDYHDFESSQGFVYGNEFGKTILMNFYKWLYNNIKKEGL